MIAAKARPNNSTPNNTLQRLPWPTPALLAWGLAWALYSLALRGLQLPAAVALALGCAVGVLASLALGSRWRQLLVALGFPLSALALQGAQLPALAWLAAAGVLLVAYPLRAWRDAPFFPTALHALDGLDRCVKLPPHARILDAGCGAGHGLQALARVWPRARLHGVEWSRLLAWWAARRVPQAAVQRGDMWAGSWRDHELVYLFQRPESMARAWGKACAEMREGTYVVSLEFAVDGVAPVATLAREGQRPVLVYRVGAKGAGDPPSMGARNSR